MATLPDCPRCSGNGRIRMYSHVKTGVCFRCMGYGADLPAIGKALSKALQDLRKAYRAAVAEDASQETLVEIVARGKAAAKALNQHVQMVQCLQNELRSQP